MASECLLVEDATLPDQIEQIVLLIASGGDGQLAGEGVDGEGVVDVGHRAHPADADVVFGLAVLEADVRHVVRHVLQPLRALDARGVRVFAAAERCEA